MTLVRRYGGKSKRERRARRNASAGGDLSGTGGYPSDSTTTTVVTRRAPRGSGIDGALHYTTNTVLAQGAYVIHATDLTIDAGKNLNCHPDDPGIIVYVNGTLTMGAGSSITAFLGTATVGGDGGAAGGNGGDGGTGGRWAGFVLVFANDVNMSATAVIGGGDDGGAGTDGALTSGGPTGAGAGNVGTIPCGLGSSYFRGYIVGTGQPLNGNFGVSSGSPGTAGTKVDLASHTLNNWDNILKDVRQFLHVTGLGFATTPANWFLDPNLTIGYSASSGCGGWDDGGLAGNRAIGGPAGTSAGFFKDGKVGTGTPDPGVNVGGSATGGGGGGAGGHGGITVLVVSGTVTAAGILSAKGGNGGAAGSGFRVGAGRAQAGEPGPGGNGGALYYWGPKWTTVGGTFTAAGGTKGAEGISYNGASPPAAASNGDDGYSYPDPDPV